MSRSIFLLPALVACGSDSAPGQTAETTSYELRVEPQIPANLSGLFDDVTHTILRIEPQVGDTVEAELDDVSSEAYSQLEHLGPLEDVTLSIIGRDKRGQDVVFGRSELLSISEGESTVRLLISRTDALGWMGGLDEGLHMGALVAMGGGRFLLFGGTHNGLANNDEGSNDILSFQVAPPDDNLMFQVVGTMPEFEEGLPGRVGHAAVLLTGNHDDQGKVLIAGGSTGGQACANASRDVSLYDPDTGEFTDLGRGGRLGSPQFHLTGVEDSAGNVVLGGGSDGCPGDENGVLPASAVHFYDTARRETSTMVLTEGDHHAPWMPRLAALTDVGTMVCGGVEFESQYDYYRISQMCHLVTLGGALEEDWLNLPIPMAWQGMTTLQDGRVLVTGGFTDGDSTIANNTELPASDRAFIYDGDTWLEVGRMRVARAMHSSVLLPDGRVMLAGGVSQSAELTFWDSESAMACAEVFDPIAGVFTALDDCDADSATGSLATPSAHMMAAADPDYGALLVGGLAPGQDASPDASLLITAHE